MSKADTARSIMFAIAAMGIVFSVSGLVVGQSMQTADATHPSHRHHNDENDNNGNNPAAASSPARQRATAMVTILGSPVAAVSVVSDPMWQH